MEKKWLSLTVDNYAIDKYPLMTSSVLDSRCEGESRKEQIETSIR